MAVEVSANFPGIPKGTPMDIGGVLVENGGSTTLDEDQELSFVGRHRKTVKDQLSGSEFVKVKGSGKYGDKAVEDMFPPLEETVVQEEEEEEEGGES